MQLDITANLFFSAISSNLLIETSKALSYIFEPISIIIISLVISLILYIRKKRKDSFLFASIMLISGIILYLLKEIVHRTRPENALISESSFSFPSGHALISIVFLSFIIYFTIKNLKCPVGKTIISILGIFLIISIGLSRLILNVHWLSDILAGWLIGLIILFLGISVKAYLRKI